MQSNQDLTTKSGQPVVMRDCVVVAQKLPATLFDNGIPYGEFKLPHMELPLGAIIQRNQDDPVPRLYAHIKGLIETVSKEHSQANCEEDGMTLLADKVNHVTRLITNEFQFYTSRALTVAQFEMLLQQIVTLAAKQPANLHFILASFAVKTKDDRVMNVVPHIECNATPMVNLIVKNYVSRLDPVYVERDRDTQPVPYPNVARADDYKHLIPVPLHKIMINQSECYFAFENTLICNTAGGTSFYSCVDICLDHSHAVAKKNINNQLDEMVRMVGEGRSVVMPPIHCAHVVTSNYIEIFPNNIIVPPTHADPIATGEALGRGVPMDSSHFGTRINMHTRAYLLSLLPVEQLKKVKLCCPQEFNERCVAIKGRLGFNDYASLAEEGIFGSKSVLSEAANMRRNLANQRPPDITEYNGYLNLVVAVTRENEKHAELEVGRYLGKGPIKKLSMSLAGIANTESPVCFNFIPMAIELPKRHVMIGLLQGMHLDQTSTSQCIYIHASELKRLNRLPTFRHVQATMQAQMELMSKLIENLRATLTVEAPVVLNDWPDNLLKAARAYCEYMGYQINANNMPILKESERTGYLACFAPAPGQPDSPLREQMLKSKARNKFIRDGFSAPDSPTTRRR